MSFNPLLPLPFGEFHGKPYAGGPARTLCGVGPDDVQRFQQDGFLVVPELCSQEEISRIRALLTGLFAKHAGRDEGNQFDMLSLDRNDEPNIQPQIIKPSQYAPALLRTDYFKSVQVLARQLLGPDAEFSFDHSILKPAGSAAATPWHQDEAHHDDADFHHEQISFWMPLQDVSERNGCMQYVPGSNRGPLLPHRSPNDDPRVHAIECPGEYFNEQSAVAKPVPAGWCILHAGRTLHSALPNRSSADRLVYVIAFRGPLTRRPAQAPFSWLAAKRTASEQRRALWRSRGGAWVLLARRLMLLLLSDCRTAPRRLAAYLRSCRIRWARLRRRRQTNTFH